MLKKTLPQILGIAILIAILTVGTALAAKVTVNINGGSLTLSPSGDSALTDIVLDGTDTSGTGVLAALKVTDARGTGTGWKVDVSATDFQDITDPAKTIPSTGFSVTAVNLTPINGSGGVSGATGALNPPLTLMDSPNPGGRGSYRATPDLKLQVPAETYLGTYTSTVTQTLISY